MNIQAHQSGRVVQSETCLTADTCLTTDLGVASWIPAQSHTFAEINHKITFKVILLGMSIADAT